tara:strand:+ start:342 stop:1013 length:672 start_codon:yes stop_codon:yes gene_type:complete
MHQQISKKIFFYIAVLILLGSINNLNFYYFEFPKIKKIDITGINNEQKIRMLKNLDYMKFQNIFFLETLRVNKIISSNNLIEKYYIHKRYPSTLKIEIIKTEILANLLKDGSNYLVGANGKLIETTALDESKPFIFGKIDIKSFINLKNKLENSNFDYENIKNFYFFNSDRWDLEMKDGILIKLPQKNIDKALKMIFEFISENKLNDINIIDARINNQIIING